MYKESQLKWLDWVVVAATLLVPVFIGIFFALKSNHSNEDLLVGGRKMRLFPVAASIMVTYVSSVTVLGFPAEVYSFGSQIFMLHVISAIVFPVSAFLFVDFFYPMKLTSVNEYLEKRFDSKWTRRLGSATFILQQTTIAGVVLYAPSIAFRAFLGFPTWMSIIGMGVCGTMYTSFGGIKAVVWTDAFQFLMVVAGMTAILVRAFLSSGGIVSAFTIASENGRLNFIDLTFDPFMRHNLWNFIIGTGFYALMQPGVNQLQVQRYNSMPSICDARKSIILSVPLNMVVMTLCLLTGISIFATYAHCDPLMLGLIERIDDVVPHFVVTELSQVPGILGLFSSCIFSAVLSSFSSVLNSLLAVTWEDFLSRLEYFKTMTPNGQLNVSRLAGLVYGTIIVGLAFGAQNFGSIYSATFAAVGATSGAIFGVFLLGMFFPFVDAAGAIGGLLTGLTSMIAVSVGAFLQSKELVPLPSFVDECDAGFGGNFIRTSNSIVTTSTTINPILLSFGDDAVEDNFLTKIIQLSYLNYSLAGAIITILVAVLFSIVEMACNKTIRKPQKIKYLHPFVQKIYGVMDSSK